MPQDGDDIEGYQFTNTARLDPAIALTSITALTLLNLRDDSRDEKTKDRPASEYLNNEDIEILSMWRHGKVKSGLDGEPVCAGPGPPQRPSKPSRRPPARLSEVMEKAGTNSTP